MFNCCNNSNLNTIIVENKDIMNNQFNLVDNINDSKINGVIFGMCIGDSLAFPAHWYYNINQLKHDFGRITKYESSKLDFPNSIMNKSNTGGGGRGNSKGNIVGDVILKGKKKYWLPNVSYHYHYGLKPGENTLEILITRLVLREAINNNGVIDDLNIRKKYVEFMTGEDSYNDIYAATAHRMFFRNYVNNKELKDCPDNDYHNVDAIDGLTNIIPIILIGYKLNKNINEIFESVNKTISLFRKTKVLQNYGYLYTELLINLLNGKPHEEQVENVAKKLNFRLSKYKSDPVVACYIDQSFKALLHFLYKYGNDPYNALVASTNAGGENVARGALLGALVGAIHGIEKFPDFLVNELLAKDNIYNEISSIINLN